MQTTPVAVSAHHPARPPPPIPPPPPPAPPTPRTPSRRLSEDTRSVAKWSLAVAIVFIVGALGAVGIERLLDHKCNCGNNGCTESKHRAMQRR